MTGHSQDLFEAALELAERSFAVLPTHTTRGGACSCGGSSCRSPGKHPRTEHGLRDASRDATVLREWWRRWPDANVGIATGAASGLVVLDVDPRHCGDESLAAIESYYGALPETPESSSGGGGCHFYFAHPGGTVRSKSNINVDGLSLGGLDIRADGGYIIAPPSLHVSGRPYEWILSLMETPPASLPAWLLRACTSGTGQSTRSFGPGTGAVPAGERNQTLFGMAAAWRSSGDDEKTILTRLRAVPCDPPLGDDEIVQVARSACAGPKSYHYTDLGNARRLITLHGDDLKFCKGWLCWTGTHWQRDTTGEVSRRAKDTIIALYGDASRTEDDGKRKSLVGHLRRSESESRIKAMVALAASEKEVALRPEAFDSDPWLFNVENGTIDLRAGVLRQHRREDLITRVAPVNYDPTAAHPGVEAFLSRVIPDPELRGYLCRAVGTSLTGITEDERLFFVHGPTNSGKSTFAEAVKAMLGPYAVTADFNTFLRKRESGISNDIARLAGARLVVSLEVEDGKQLAAALIKSLTGGDTIAARFLHNEYFEFRPQFKLWLVANHRPKADAEDAATWRRIRVLPFTESIPEEERDESVKRTLRDDPSARSALLAWAVKGCIDWQSGGLREPDAVRRATEEYRDECDPLSDFLRECCVQEPAAKVGVAELFAAYVKWSSELGEKPLSQRELGKLLTSRSRKKAVRGTGGKSFRHGVRLSEPSEASEPPADTSLYESPQEKEAPGGSLTSLGSPGACAPDSARYNAPTLGLDG